MIAYAHARLPDVVVCRVDGDAFDHLFRPGRAEGRLRHRERKTTVVSHRRPRCTPIADPRGTRSITHVFLAELFDSEPRLQDYLFRSIRPREIGSRREYDRVHVCTRRR